MSVVKTLPVVARAGALLPAGSAYDATGVLLPVTGATSATFWPLYTPATTASTFSLAIEVSADGASWFPAPIADSTLAESGLTATLTNYGLVVAWPVTSGVSPLKMAVFRLDVSDWANVRIRAAETTQPGAQGTLSVTMTSTVPQ